jgi:hypothetical protein
LSQTVIAPLGRLKELEYKTARVLSALVLSDAKVQPLLEGRCGAPRILFGCRCAYFYSLRWRQCSLQRSKIVMQDRRNRERRGVARSRVLKGAKLVLGKSSMDDCVVRNVTNAGARIHIPSTIDLPEAFDLTFDGGYSFRRCRIIWRSATETGVQFI